MNRFKGKNHKRLLVGALGQQRTLSCSAKLISQVARAAVVKAYPKDARLIIQGFDDNSVAFILNGRVNILVKDQKVAERVAGQHVGEMSVIDPSARRSATVVAAEETTVAWVDEKHFTKIATAHPELWRALAVELADRLRQRGALVRDRNSRAEVFIGSSSESIAVARAVETALSPDPIKINRWNRGVFGASESIIESLERQVEKSDFAILILTADDKLRTRRKKQAAPRDNVVFELGLFMGGIGRKRTFMLVERRTKALRLPPDLHGVTYLPIITKDKKSLKKTVAEAISEIRKRISELNTR